MADLQPDEITARGEVLVHVTSAALERGGIGADGLAQALHDERRREGEFRRAGALIVRWEARDVPAAGEIDRSRGAHQAQIALAAKLGQFTGRVLDA